MQFSIPEFKECWWDSLLGDLLDANLLGMAAGWVTLQVREVGRNGGSGICALGRVNGFCVCMRESQFGTSTLLVSLLDSGVRPYYESYRWQSSKREVVSVSARASKDISCVWSLRLFALFTDKARKLNTSTSK